MEQKKKHRIRRDRRWQEWVQLEAIRGRGYQPDEVVVRQEH